jgi:hypothetical protein
MGISTMKWTPREMIIEVLYCHGRPMTPQAISGAVRVMFAVKLKRKAIRHVCFGSAELKRDGSGAYRLDPELRLDRLVRELMAA